MTATDYLFLLDKKYQLNRYVLIKVLWTTASKQNTQFLKKCMATFPKTPLSLLRTTIMVYHLFPSSKMFFCIFQRTAECTIIKSICTTTFTKLKTDVGRAHML